MRLEVQPLPRQELSFLRVLNASLNRNTGGLSPGPSKCAFAIFDLVQLPHLDDLLINSMRDEQGPFGADLALPNDHFPVGSYGTRQPRLT